MATLKLFLKHSKERCISVGVATDEWEQFASLQQDTNDHDIIELVHCQ